MEKGLYHLTGISQAVQDPQHSEQQERARNICGKSAGSDGEWTFQTLLSAVEDGDAQRLHENISHLECRIRETSKRIGFFLPRRTQVLESLQDYVAIHGRHLTSGQIREYRMSSEGRRVAMIYHV